MRPHVRIYAMVVVLVSATSGVLGQTPEVRQSVVDHGAETPRTNDSARLILAQPPPTLSYQGFLTSDSGTPLTGQYDLVFTLYDDPNTGTAEWGPETHSDVQVKDGLFTVALGVSEPLRTNDFDESLYLAVSVNGTDVTPRQPLLAAPYAFSLIPGAEVEGVPATGNYGLSVENDGEGSTDRGLYVKGWQYGLVAEEVGPDGDVGIYSPDFVEAKGFRSGDDSYLWVPAMSGWFYPNSGCGAFPQYHGSVRIECSSAATVYFNIGIPLPAVLYGQEVEVESISVYYDLDNAGSYIDVTRLMKLTDATSSVQLIYDSTNRTSTVPTSYSLTPSDGATLTAESGALNLNLTLSHDGNTAHDVTVGGVRVRLGHTSTP